MVIDERFFRPAERFELRGDYSKAKQRLGWEPEVSFEELVRLMVETDLEKLSTTTLRDAKLTLDSYD